MGRSCVSTCWFLSSGLVQAEAWNPSSELSLHLINLGLGKQTWELQCLPSHHPSVVISTTCNSLCLAETHTREWLEVFPHSLQWVPSSHMRSQASYPFFRPAEAPASPEVLSGPEGVPEALVQCKAWLEAYFQEPAATEGLALPALHHPVFQQGW